MPYKVEMFSNLELRTDMPYFVKFEAATWTSSRVPRETTTPSEPLEARCPERRHETKNKKNMWNRWTKHVKNHGLILASSGDPRSSQIQTGFNEIEATRMDKYLLNIVTSRENLRLSMTSFLGSAHGPTAHCRTLHRPRQDSWTRGKSMSSLNKLVWKLSDWGNEKGGPPRIVQAMIAMTCEWYTRYTRLILLFFSQRHVETYPQLICKWTSPSLAMVQDRTPQNEKTWETIILDQVSITIHPDYTCSFLWV
jgi:hypothetical protein